MLNFTSHDISSIKDQINLEDLIGEQFELMKKGENYQISCPWHDDKNPSLVIYPKKQTYRCWVCDQGGDAYEFLEKSKGFTFPEAVKYLANKVGYKLDNSGTNQTEWIKKEELWETIEEATKIYSKKLWETPEAREYLKKREINEETAKDFQLGYAPDSWNFIMKKMPHTGNKKLEQVGLIKKSKSENFYDFFRKRLIIPIKDLSGKIVGFSGRTIINDKIKYINTPDTSPIYNKSSILYGLPEAQRAVRDTKELIVTEGYLDMILAYQHKIDNLVAICGTAFTDQQANLIKRRFPDTKITLCLDGDKAGEEAALRSASKLIGRGDIGVCTLPQGQDPADIIVNKGRTEFLKKIAETTHLFDFYIEKQSKGNDIRIPEKGIAFLERIANDFSKIPLATQGIYTGHLARIMETDRKSIEAVLFQENYRLLQADDMDSRPLAEYKLLRGLIKFPEIRQEFTDKVTMDTFTSPERQAVYNVVIEKNVSEGYGGLFIGTEDDPTDNINNLHHGLNQIKLKNLLFPNEAKRRPITLQEIEKAYITIRAYDGAENIFQKYKEGTSIESLEQIIDNLENE